LHDERGPLLDLEVGLRLVEGIDLHQDSSCGSDRGNVRGGFRAGQLAEDGHFQDDQVCGRDWMTPGGTAVADTLRGLAA